MVDERFFARPCAGGACALLDELVVEWFEGGDGAADDKAEELGSGRREGLVTWFPGTRGG